MEQHPIQNPHWTYIIQPDVRERIAFLLHDRCGTSLVAHVDKDKVHLTTMLRAVHNIWHTVSDDAPVEDYDSKLLTTLDRELCRYGDAIVRSVLIEVGLLGQGDIKYLLVRNFRTAVRIRGFEEDEWVLLNMTSDQDGIRFMYQPNAGGNNVLVEDIPWREVSRYLAKMRFQLDHAECGDFGTIEEQLCLKPLEQSPSPRLLKIGDPDIVRSLREL